MDINIGKFIFENRKKLNLTQKELADKLYVSRETISIWENGKSIPDYQHIDRLCEIFETNFLEFYAIEKDKTIKKRKLKKLKSFIMIFIIGVFLCLLELVLSLANIDTLYKYLIFILFIVLIIIMDIIDYFIA